MKNFAYLIIVMALVSSTLYWKSESLRYESELDSALIDNYYQQSNYSELEGHYAYLYGLWESEREKVAEKSTEIENLKEKYKSLEKIKVEATAYSASVDETDSTPWQTALMTKPTVGRTIAVSRDLDFLLGKKVKINGYGVFVVEDLMNSRFTKRIDFFKGSKREAIKFGKKELEIIPLHHI